MRLEAFNALSFCEWDLGFICQFSYCICTNLIFFIDPVLSLALQDAIIITFFNGTLSVLQRCSQISDKGGFANTPESQVNMDTQNSLYQTRDICKYPCLISDFRLGVLHKCLKQSKRSCGFLLLHLL